MVSDPVIDIPSRQREESSIVVKWLQRLHDCIRDQPGNLFAEAVNRCGLSREQLRAGEGLNHHHFDMVMEYIGRSVPDLTFRFMSHVELLDLGMLGYAILSCDTVQKAQEFLGRYLDLTSDRYTEKRSMEDGFLVIRPIPTWRHLGEDASIAEDCLGGNWHAIKLMLGPVMDYYGASAHFAYPAPDHVSAYEDFFSGPAPCILTRSVMNSEFRLNG